MKVAFTCLARPYECSSKGTQFRKQLKKLLDGTLSFAQHIAFVPSIELTLPARPSNRFRPLNNTYEDASGPSTNYNEFAIEKN